MLMFGRSRVLFGDRVIEQLRAEEPLQCGAARSCTASTGVKNRLPALSQLQVEDSELL